MMGGILTLIRDRADSKRKEVWRGKDTITAVVGIIVKGLDPEFP